MDASPVFIGICIVLVVTLFTITIRYFMNKSKNQVSQGNPLETTDDIVKRTGFNETGETTTTTETDESSGEITNTTRDIAGKTMSVTTSKDGSKTQTTVKDKDGTVLADNKTSVLDQVKALAPTLAQGLAAGAARDIVLIGGSKILQKATKEIAEKGVKSALQQTGKIASRQGAGLAMKYLGYVTKKSAQNAINFAAETGARKAAKEATEKIIASELKRLGKKTIEEVTDKVAKEALEKAIKEAGEKAAEKAAQEAVEKVSKKVVMTTAEKAVAKAGAVTAAKIGARAGVTAAKMASKIEMGPVGIALMAFDVISLALDVAGCGGFQEGPFDNKTWTKTRDKLSAEEKALYDDSNADGDDHVRFPVILGPFDKYDSVTLQSRLLDKVKAAVADPKNSFVKSVMDKLKIESANKTMTDTEIDKFIDDNLDIEGLLLELTKTMCTDLKGKIIMDNGTKYAGCSWPDVTTCEGSFKYPILEANDTDKYAFWNKAKLECNHDPVSQNMRGICEVEKFGFDKETKICVLNETYCKQKGLKWDGSSCKLTKGQEVAEMMFGTTVVRGLNALYSADQYGPCPPGSRPAGEIAALGAAITPFTGPGGILLATYLGQTMCASDKCPDGQDRVSGMCYDQCKPGYNDKADGITGAKVQGMCYKCPDGFKKTTAGMCEREKCPEGQEQGSGLGAGFCYKKCSTIHGPEYTETDGASICKKSCPVGMVTDPLTCRRPPQTKVSATAIKTCPSGWSQSVAGPGGMCQQDCSDGYKKYGGLCYHPKAYPPDHNGALSVVYSYQGCPAGYNTLPLTCSKPLSCRTWDDDCANRGLFNECLWGVITRCTGPDDYGRSKYCPEGYADKAGMCYAVTKPVPKSTSIMQIGECKDPAKPEKAGGMCYAPCSEFGGSFKRSAVGLCQMDLLVTPRTKTRAPEGPFVIAKPADQYSRQPNGISYKVFQKDRIVPFGKGPNGC